METLLQDIRYATRTLLKVPGFTAVIVVSIALGIAANTTVFSVVNGLLLGTLPVRDPGRLVAFNNGQSLPYPDYLDYRDQTKQVFEGVSAHFPLIPASLGGNGEAERVWGEVVSGNYFNVAGVSPLIGRAIQPQDDQVPGRDAVVVLSHSLWQRRFGADPGVVGRAVVLNGQRFTVVGVVPRGFHGTVRGILADFWAPLAMVGQLMPELTKDNINNRRDSQWVLLFARLKPGVTRAQAAAALNVVKNRIDDEYHKDMKKHRPDITLTAAGGLLGDLGTPVLSLMAVLMVVVGSVLLVACANVANLLLARATARQKEIAIRVAIGGGRGRLVRQLLTESLLLALAGAAAGFLLAAVTARALSRFQTPLPFPFVFDFNVDTRVLMFTVALSLVTALLFGLAPALRATRPDLVPALKDEPVGLGRARRFGLRNFLVVVQVALSLVLLVGAGLFVRGLGRAASIDIGMQPQNVLLMAIDAQQSQRPRAVTQQFLTQLRERVSALPGVRAVTFVDSLPLSIGGTSFGFKLEGGKNAKEQNFNADVFNVGRGYFQTMGIPLVRGRDFSRAAGDEHAVIINETMAQRAFGNGDPLGRQLVSDELGAKTLRTVIGVARNSKSRTLGEDPANCAYLPIEAAPDSVFGFYGITIAVKTTGAPMDLARAVRAEIRTLEPNLAVFNTETMQDHVDKSLLLPRICATLLGVFGAVGLTLAAIGLYGVMSFSVRRRTREIGIRMALGAEPGSVLRMVLRQGLALTAVGLTIGLAIALALGRFTASLLYGISGTDLVTFLAVPAVLVAAALVASVLPAHRAARIEPTTALRYE